MSGMDDRFARWHQLNNIHHTALRENLCTCCARIDRDGMGPRPVRAVVEWVCPNGAVDKLCMHCLGIWATNAADDPELAPTRIVGINDNDAATRR